MADLADAIRAKLDAVQPLPLEGRQYCKVLRAVVDRHGPGGTTGCGGYVFCAACPPDTPHPCPELLVIAKGLGVEVATRDVVAGRGVAP